MKKMIFIAMAISISQFALAQSTEKKVSRIREQYNSAQEVTKFMNDDEWMENECHTLTFKSKINYAGRGKVEHDTKVLLTRAAETNENTDDFNTFRPWLTRENIVYSAGIYREMLFDKVTGKLLFCYQRAPLSNGDVGEVRFYYDNGKLIKAVPDNVKSYYIRTPKEIISIAESVKKMVANYNYID